MKSTETLVSCPDCGQPNFTPRGLSGHRNSKHCRTTAPQTAAPAKSKALVVAGSREITIADLDVMPSSPQARVTLADMSVGQLTVAFSGLERARGEYDNLSGLCATLGGLVLEEVKRKVGHGKFTPWLKEHFPKSAVTARQYMALAAQFSKTKPKFPFEQLTLSLLDGAQGSDGQSLDFSNPLVRGVAQWTSGRTFYQLREEEIRGGGNRHPKCPHCEGDLKSKDQALCPHCGKPTGQAEKSPEEIHAELLEDTRLWAQGQSEDHYATRELWKLLPDHEAEALATTLAERAKAIRAWVKLPARQRKALAIEEVLA